MGCTPSHLIRLQRYGVEDAGFGEFDGEFACEPFAGFGVTVGEYDGAWVESFGVVNQFVAVGDVPIIVKTPRWLPLIG
jgi:hypothetical protein